MNDQDRGIYRKYHVERLNDPSGKHADCAYFVLDPRHDPIARVALDAYWKEARKQGYEALAVDLRGWVTAERYVEASGTEWDTDVLPDGLKVRDNPTADEIRNVAVEIDNMLESNPAPTWDDIQRTARAALLAVRDTRD